MPPAPAEAATCGPGPFSMSNPYVLGAMLASTGLAGVEIHQLELHHRPAHPWSLDELAHEGGMSRSSLAESFANLVGIPPMQYLARWRMQLAATLLSTTTLSIAEIAERVGYGSEAALSRAYKRAVGVAPAEWRRGKRPAG